MSDAEPETEPTVEDTVAQATTLLGEPEALFRANPRRLRLKFLLAVALILWGITAGILWFGIGPANAHDFILHFIFWPPAIGGGLLYHMWRHRGLRVLVYPTGLLRLAHGEAESFAWDEIDSVRCKLDVQGQLQIERDDNGKVACAWLETSAPTIQVWNVWIELTRADGVIAKFTAALADFPELVERIQRGTFPHLWVAKQAEMNQGQSVAFGEHIIVTRDEIRSGKFSMRWAEAKTASIAGRIFTVKRKGAWVASIAREASAIPNLHVLFGLAAEHGVVEADGIE
jgi:hypothetical protein